MSDGALALRNPVTDQPNKVAQFQIEMGFHAGPVAARIRMDLAVRCQSQTAISPAALRFGQLDLSTCELYKRDLRTFGNSEERHSAESCYVRTDLPKPRSRARREPELSRDASLFSVLEASWDSWEQRHEEECRNAEQEATGQINLSSAPVRSAGHVHPFFLPPPLPSPPLPLPLRRGLSNSPLFTSTLMIAPSSFPGLVVCRKQAEHMPPSSSSSPSTSRQKSATSGSKTLRAA